MAGSGSKFNILILLAIIMAVVTSGLVFMLIKSAKDEAYRAGVAQGTSSKQPTASGDSGALALGDVLVARQDISPGIPQVTPEMFEIKKVTKSAIPSSAFTNLDQIKDRVPTHFIPAGDIIMPSKLKPKSEITRASYLITPGKRYFSLEIDGQKMGTQTVSNMLRVGDEVDILATYDSNGTKVSRIILQKLKIIDVVNGDTQGKPGAEAPNQRLGTGQTITFEGSPQDAEFFKALQSSGMDYIFILRNINDTSIAETEGKKTRDVIAKIIPQEEIPAPTVTTPAPAAPTRRNY